MVGCAWSPVYAPGGPDANVHFGGEAGAKRAVFAMKSLAFDANLEAGQASLSKGIGRVATKVGKILAKKSSKSMKLDGEALVISAQHVTFRE